MLIHEAAAITGLTIDAIRYYERQHLLDERHICRSMWLGLQSRLALHAALLVEAPHQRGGRLTAPGVADQPLKLVDVDGGKPNQDGWEAVVVRLGEEHTRASGEQHVLLGEVADSDGEDAEVGHARLLRMHALHPDPGDSFALALGSDGNAMRSSSMVVSGSESAMRPTSFRSAIDVPPDRRCITGDCAYQPYAAETA